MQQVRNKTSTIEAEAPGRRSAATLRIPGCSRWLLLFLACLLANRVAAADPLRFKVVLTDAAVKAGEQAGPFSGRLYVFCSRNRSSEPRLGPNWFSPEPFFGVEVRDVSAGQTLVIDDTADGFPDVLSKLPRGKYRVQAVLDHSFDCHNHAAGVGNFFSQAIDWEATDQGGDVELTLTDVVAGQGAPRAEWLREVDIPSPLLSAYHKRPVRQQATIVLPADYDRQPEKRYPTLYIISGFGGNHRSIGGYARSAPQVQPGEEAFIRVFLNADCKWGHHVFADSAANGPRGQALIDELIPHIDAQFRTVASAGARYVNGHSSGGWSSLWLQVSYPDAFGGVWSTSPDPVDFRDYQQVDLYASPPLSLYVDEQGQRRPIARRGETPVLWYDDFGKMDDVIGRGGQLRSFEAVFSPLGPDGLPRKLWDRQTGRVDPDVAKAWEAYDIRLKIERNWRELEPKLRGKLHIVTGSLDTFYLEGAVRKLGETLRQLGSDAEVTIVEGADHGSVLSPDVVNGIRRQMSETYRKFKGPQ